MLQLKCMSVKVQTDEIKQNHFQVQVELEPRIISVRWKQGHMFV